MKWVTRAFHSPVVENCDQPQLKINSFFNIFIIAHQQHNDRFSNNQQLLNSESRLYIGWKKCRLTELIAKLTAKAKIYIGNSYYIYGYL